MLLLHACADLETAQARHLAGLDEQLVRVEARAQSAAEKYIAAKAATAEACRALSLSPQDSKLQMRRRHAEMREGMRKKSHDTAQRVLQDTLRSRQAMRAMMDGEGERPALCQRQRTVQHTSVCNMSMADGP